MATITHLTPLIIFLSFITQFQATTPTPVNQGAAIFLTHGGGPYPLLEPSLHQQMFSQLSQIPKKFPSPKAIIFVSAHWEETHWSIIDHDTPPLYYDYYGFPDEAYNFTYQLKSTIELREQIRQKLLIEGIQLKSDFQRGYDHGVFVPMMIMYPSGSIPPVIELSIKRNLNPEEHYSFGIALRKLKKEGYLIICSGASSHGGFGSAHSWQKSQKFSKDLSSTFMGDYDQDKILKGIKAWKSLSHAREMHPREEHLVPLFVALGVYEGNFKEEQKYTDKFMNLSLRNYIFK